MYFMLLFHSKITSKVFIKLWNTFLEMILFTGSQSFRMTMSSLLENLYQEYKFLRKCD